MKKTIIVLFGLLFSLGSTQVYAHAQGHGGGQTISHIVCIDAGHGGTDAGATATYNGTNITEAQENLVIAQDLQTLLQNNGYQVVMTRSDNNTTLDNAQRAAICNNANAGVLVSIHLNGSTNPNIDYSLVLYGKKTKDKAFAQVIDNNLSLGIQNNGITNFADGMLLKANMPAVLTESVFLSNPTEQAQLVAGTRQPEIAQQLYNGVTNWLATH